MQKVTAKMLGSCILPCLRCMRSVLGLGHPLPSSCHLIFTIVCKFVIFHSVFVNSCQSSKVSISWHVLYCWNSVNFIICVILFKQYSGQFNFVACVILFKQKQSSTRGMCYIVETVSISWHVLCCLNKNSLQLVVCAILLKQFSSHGICYIVETKQFSSRGMCYIVETVSIS